MKGHQQIPPQDSVPLDCGANISSVTLVYDCLVIISAAMRLHMTTIQLFYFLVSHNIQILCVYILSFTVS